MELRALNIPILYIAAILFYSVEGKTQRLQPGPQVLSFFSDLDDSDQPYSIYIPQNYDENKKYPLVVMLHGAGSNHRLDLRRVFGNNNINGETDVEASLYFPPWKDIDAIVVAPYARGTAGYQGFVEKDVMDMLADVKRRFSIDENRTYLTGLSMGGGGTLWIGLGHPDIWAAIAPVCPAPPNGTDALAPNALNMPVKFFHGDQDIVAPVDISRNWVDKLKRYATHVEYVEYPGVQHDSWVNAYQDGQIFDWFFQFTRNPSPDRVRHAAHDLAHGKSYWVRFDEKDPGEVAFIDAVFESKNTVDIRTKHLNAFTITMQSHPKFDVNSALRVIIDGAAYLIPAQQHASNTSLEYSFYKSQSGWIQGRKTRDGFFKRAELEGPIIDAFSSRHIYVYGTLGNPSPAELQARRDVAFKAAEWSVYRDEFYGRIKFFPRVLSDQELRPSDYESSNLILFGTKETNQVITDMANELPLHLDVNKGSDHGLMYVHPNSYGRYVVINSGLPWWHAREAHSDFLPDRYYPLFSFRDFILYDAQRTTLAEGFFGNDWSLSDSDKEVLVGTGLLNID